MGNMRKVKERILVITSILTLLVAGCGEGEGTGAQNLPGIGIPLETEGDAEGQKNPGNGGGQGAVGVGGGQDSPGSLLPDSGSVTWQPAYFPLEKAYTQILAAGDNLYGCVTSEGRTLLDSIGKESHALEGTTILPDLSLQSGIAADPEGYIYLLKEGEDGAALCRIAPGAGSADYESILLEDSQDADNMFLKGSMTDARGYLYIWCGMLIPGTERIESVDREVWREADRVYVMDRERKTLFYEEIFDVSGVQVLCFQVGRDGTPFFLLKDELDICVQEIDVDRQEGMEEGHSMERIRLGTALDCFGMEDANLPEHMTYTGSGWLYCRNGELVEFRYETQEKAQVLNLASQGIVSEDILFLAKGDDRIEIIDRDRETGTLEYILFTPGESDRKTVTLGLTFSAQDLESAVAQFNRSSNGYRVEIVDYLSRTGDYNKACEQLKLDVVTGKAPDIISVSGIDYRMFAGKGVLADLYDFMKEDGECSREMLVESVAKAYEDQGHLYCIAPSFQLHSMWGYSDVTEGKSGVTFSELLGLLQGSGKDLSAVGGFSADEPVLTRLCTAAMDEFVDWERGTCEFDGDYFREVLSFAGAYRPAYTESSYSEQIRNREQVLTVGMISSVADYQIQKGLYGGDLAFIGYPTVEGTGTAVDYRASAVAINAGKEDLAGAWAFVKFYLLEGYDGQGFPMVKEEFEQAMKDAMEDDFTETEGGGGTERVPKDYYSDGSREIAAYAATAEEVEAVRELVERAENRFEYHPAIQNIINEEAQGYLSGQVDLDKTVEKIQNRVSLLLQESL